MLRRSAAPLAGAALLLLLYTVPSGAQTPDDPLAQLPASPVEVPDPDPSPQPAATGAELVGTFRLAAGNCGGAVTGSWFRMAQPGGNASGPFVTNSDSPCADKTYTPLRPGTDGGLVTGRHQPQPDPAFSANGGGRASRITAPQRFYGVDFASATNATDPQTGLGVAAPRITQESGRLSGDLRSFAASWNNQHFNQGAPKPDGRATGATSLPRGTFDPATGRYSLEWTSQISGGPFNNFTGIWHFEGTFAPRGQAPPTGGGASEPPATASSGSEEAATTIGTTGTTAGTGRLADTGPGGAQATGAALMLVALGLTRLRRRILPDG